MTILDTERLRLRLPEAADAPFILRLVNDPEWLRQIGDRGVHTEEDARRFIEQRLLEPFHRHGFGLWVAEAGGVPLGLCGLLRREALEDVDIGFAFLPEARGRGLAREAAGRVLDHAAGELGLRRVVAITRPGNAASARLLERLGLSFRKVIELEHSPLRLFAIEFDDLPRRD